MRGEGVVLDFGDRPHRIDDPEANDRVDLDRYVVSRDHVLWLDVVDVCPQADAVHPIDRPEHND